ncbi:MAG TPA: hypothetical protein PLX04_08710, partial [Caldisericia bacterium]|nr:hypothetical protein [Caldisericia bacterium]
ELVDALKQKAQDAVNIMRELLGMAPLITGEGKTGTETGSEGIISGIDISKLPEEKKRLLQQLIGGKWPGNLPPPGLPKIPGSSKDTDSWIGREKYPTFGGSETSTGESAKDLVIPPGTTTQDMATISTQTKEEIQARINAYQDLKTIGATVETALREDYKKTKTEILAGMKEITPSTSFGFGKDIKEGADLVGKELANKIKTPFERLYTDPDKAPLWGQKLAAAIASGFKSSYFIILDALDDGILRAIHEYLEPHSPPEKGPLHTIDKWGASLSALFASSFTAKPVQQAVVKIAESVAYTLQDSESVTSKGWQAMIFPSKKLGLSYTGNLGKDTEYNWLRNYLLTNPEVAKAYDQRQTLYKSDVWGQLQSGVKYNQDLSIRQKFLSTVGDYDAQKYAGFFNQWYDQMLMVGSLGKVTLNDVRTFAKLHPDMIRNPAFHDRILKSDPNVYYEAIRKGILEPAAVPEGWSNQMRSLDGRIVYQGGGVPGGISIGENTNPSGIVMGSGGPTAGAPEDLSKYNYIETPHGADASANAKYGYWVPKDWDAQKQAAKESIFPSGFGSDTTSKIKWQELKVGSQDQGFNLWLQNRFNEFRQKQGGAMGWNANNLVAWGDAEKAFTQWLGFNTAGKGKSDLVRDYVSYIKGNAPKQPDMTVASQ